MKKSILLLFILMITFIFCIQNVYAKTITLDEVANNYKTIFDSFYKDITTTEYEVEVKKEDNKLIIEYSYEDKSYSATLNYNEDDNYIYYNADTTKTNEVRLAETLLVSTIIYDIGNLYGYSNNNIEKMLEKVENYNLKDDGIECITQKITEEETTNSSSVKLTTDLINSLKISLGGSFGHLQSSVDEQPSKGITETPTKKEENPKTADTSLTSIICLFTITMIIGGYSCIKYKNLK